MCCAVELKLLFVSQQSIFSAGKCPPYCPAGVKIPSRYGQTTFSAASTSLWTCSSAISCFLCCFHMYLLWLVTVANNDCLRLSKPEENFYFLMNGIKFNTWKRTKEAFCWTLGRRISNILKLNFVDPPPQSSQQLQVTQLMQNLPTFETDWRRFTGSYILLISSLLLLIWQRLASDWLQEDGLGRCAHTLFYNIRTNSEDTRGLICGPHVDFRW